MTKLPSIPLLQHAHFPTPVGHCSSSRPPFHAPTPHLLAPAEPLRKSRGDATYPHRRLLTAPHTPPEMGTCAGLHWEEQER
uniref:Uncharacterized protein n=1 Tax=Arundo donax TaxID=35708 RepID=A0A0A9F6S9_ARUDO